MGNDNEQKIADAMRQWRARAIEDEATIAELRQERDALRTLAGNIYALMIERNEDDCAFVDPAAVQDKDTRK